MENLPLAAILERDTDLLLLEELATSPVFGAWLADSLGLPSFTAPSGAWKSVVDFALGETDLLFAYHSAQQRILVLIENKIDAVFQPDQPVRYQSRASRYEQEGICDRAFVALVAPASYCSSQAVFSRSLSYEAIVAFFERQATARATFRAQIFRQAVAKSRRGYRQVNSAVVQKFWHDYWQYKQQYFAALHMKKPLTKGSRSDWPYLYDRRLKQQGVSFVHKWSEGCVEAQFGERSVVGEAARRCSLPEGVFWVQHKKIGVLYCSVPPVDRMAAFEHQTAQVHHGLSAVCGLRDFLIGCLAE